MRAVYSLVTRQQSGRSFTVSTDSRADMQRVASDNPGPGKTWPEKPLNEQVSYPHNTLTIRWVPGHRGVVDNEIADNHAKK